MSTENDMLWRDLGFVMTAAKSWASMLYTMSTPSFASDAYEFKLGIDEACKRLETTLKESR
jgi:hypothetical protein